MKKLFTIFFVLGMCFSLNANAVSIDIIANQTAVNVGDNVEIQVRVSGLNDTGAPSLGDYDINVNYDSSLFNFDRVVWGDSLLGNQLNLSGFGSLQDIRNESGWLRLFELSFDDALDLELLQAGEFTLFSVFLNATVIGSSTFSLIAIAVGDAYGNDILIDTITGTTVDIGSVSVPEPSGMLLLLLGVLAISVLRTQMPRSKE